MAYKKCRGNNIMLDRYIRIEQETWFTYQQALIDGDIMAIVSCYTVIYMQMQKVGANRLMPYLLTVFKEV